MPLPQKVIEQLGREPVKTPGWSGQLLMFSSTVLFIALIVYFGLAYGYEPYLNSQTQNIQKQLQSFSDKVPVAEQTALVNFYSQIANLQTILKTHVSGSPLFDWLEKNTETNVYLTKLNANVTSRQIAIGGVAKTLDDINQQLVDLGSQTDAVQSFVVNDITDANGKWQFDVTLTLTRSFFLAINNPAQ
ncbi:MAG TPA: hypothetical protein VNG29_03580 [Candidatus Paceibacterota bacterium]|nr:hypothetical protein [Candidatus Paceibacterota bacterium]